MTTPTTLSLSLGTCMAWVLVLSVRTQLLCMKLSMLTVLHGAVKLMFRVAPLQKSANILLARDFTAKIADVGEFVSRTPSKLPC